MKRGLKGRITGNQQFESGVESIIQPLHNDSICGRRSWNFILRGVAELQDDGLYVVTEKSDQLAQSDAAPSEERNSNCS